MTREEIAILEALVFASDTPLTPERAAEVLTDTDKKGILALFEELGREYETRGGGIHLVQVAGGFQFRTKPEMASWIRKLKAARPAMLSTAAVETLAVIAYRQPIVKSDIDRIRGVDASGALKGLLEKKIVRIVGRKDVPGKPIIYGTTKKFLEVFNLKDLTELPTLRDLKDLQDDGMPMNLELPNILGDAEPEGSGPAACPEPAPPEATERQEDDGRDLTDRSEPTGQPDSEGHSEDGPADCSERPVPPDSTDAQDDDAGGAIPELPASRGVQEPQEDGGPGFSDPSVSPALPDSEAAPGGDEPADHPESDAHPDGEEPPTEGNDERQE